MDKEQIKNILEEVQSGKMAVDQAMSKLRHFPYEDMGFAKLDTHREMRTGFPEVIFCQGKTLEQITQIAEKLSEKSSFVMATRATTEAYEAVRAVLPKAKYNKMARIILIGEKIAPEPSKSVLIVTGGTADMPVAEEAAVTVEATGIRTDKLYDAGVAGIHRLLHSRDKLYTADVIIVVAGMEGALASVVGGMTDRPVVAVPTSVGYGASFAGLSALLTMLNSCAPGVVVVNIDNGFGAGYFASVLCHQSGDRKKA